MKTFLIKIFRIIAGVCLMPLLYARYGLLVLITLAIIFIPNDENDSLTGVIMFIVMGYGSLFMLIMGPARLMKHWAGLWVWIFAIKYDVGFSDRPDVMHSASVWSHSVLKVDGREYETSVATMGGKTYEEEDHMARKAVMYGLIRW